VVATAVDVYVLAPDVSLRNRDSQLHKEFIPHVGARRVPGEN
jgi:hypothetical protein